MKPFIVCEMIFKGHSNPPAISFFVTSPELSIRERKSRLHLFSDKNISYDLEVGSR